MNLDPHSRLCIIDERVCLLSELCRPTEMINRYTQDETLCLLALIDGGLYGSVLFPKFDALYPGRTVLGVRQKVKILLKKGWVRQ